MAKKILSETDCDLFRQAAGEVRPVVSDKAPLTPLAKPKPYPQRRVPDPARRLDTSVGSDGERLFSEDRMGFHIDGIQKGVMKKLRSGYFGVDAELDLHGLTETQAKAQLLHFLYACVEDGLRCVHIIHGKGYRSAEHRPVLKNALNLWLRQHRDVLAFCSAPAHSGGTGAVYVLLRLAEKYGEDDVG